MKLTLNRGWWAVVLAKPQNRKFSTFHVVLLILYGSLLSANAQMLQVVTKSVEKTFAGNKINTVQILAERASPYRPSHGDRHQRYTSRSLGPK